MISVMVIYCEESMMDKKEFKKQSKAYSKIKEMSNQLNIPEYSIYKFVNNDKADVFIKDAQSKAIPISDIRKKIREITENK